MAEDSSSLSKGNDIEIPTLRLSEQGFNGLRVVAGVPIEECQKELAFPRSIDTFKKMAKDGTIAPALNLVEMMIARVPWTVEIPKGYETQLAAKAEFLRQNMNDMEHSWGSFIRQVVSFNRYGFSVHEKCYRYRYRENGSKYNDGLIGIEKLPIRSQDTIVGWDWKNQGRDIAGVWQAAVRPAGLNDYSMYASDPIYGDKVKIPRKKFLLFRNGTLKDNPLGESPLVGAWESWKYKKALEQVEANGISQDMQGFKVLYIPPRYMAADASQADKEVYEYYKQMMRNAHNGTQSGFILPQVVDENNNEYFKFDIVNVTGTKAYDSTKIIQRYAYEILTALTADFLVLGQGSGGSFALSENKITVSEIAIEAKLIEIQDQLNHDLIPQLFALNGWDTTVTPFFQFGKVDKQDLDGLSAFIQRVAAAGLLLQTPETVEWVHNQAGIPYVIDEAIEKDREKYLTHLTAYDSSAGEGMQTNGPGTAKKPGTKDASISNKENK
jgi:hypothetical protein